jgi:hypothetical protein
MKNAFSILKNNRTYSIELRERNYPKFEGRYNAYVSTYGQLSGEYLGNIETPLKMDITPEDMPELLAMAENFIFENRYTPVSKW